MPVPQLAPPGHLELHGVLVALTPVLISLMAALATWLIGERADTRRASAVRLLAAANLLGALAIQGLFLLPWGAVAAYPDGLAGGLLRIGWLVTGTAFALGLWSLWYWAPLRTGDGSATRWCLRVALALALPVVALPAIVIAVLADEARASGRRCFLVAASAVGSTGLALVLPYGCVQALWLVVMLAALATLTGPWRGAVALAVLVAVLGHAAW